VKRKPRLTCAKRKRGTLRCELSVVSRKLTTPVRLRLSRGRTVVASNRPRLVRGRFVLAFTTRRTLAKGTYTVVTSDRDLARRVGTFTDKLTLKRSL
jgi:hypothetical protein